MNTVASSRTVKVRTLFEAKYLVAFVLVVLATNVAAVHASLGSHMIWRQLDLNISYRFADKASCDRSYVIYGIARIGDDPKSIQTFTLTEAVQGSMNAWAQWIHGLNWTEVSANEEVLIHPCSQFGQLQAWADQTHQDADGTLIADHTWVDIHGNQLGGVEWIHHEFGHVLGLGDNPPECVGPVQTELMCSFGGGINPGALAGRDGTFRAPSQQYIDELNTMYTDIPVPEFPTPIIALLVGLAAITIARRSRKQTK